MKEALQKTIRNYSFHEAGAFWLTGSQVFKLMRGVGESLAGRVAVLSMTSLSQAEISGEKMEPFIIELSKLAEREKERETADTRAIFEPIYKGSMSVIVSGDKTNSQIFYSKLKSKKYQIRELSLLKFLECWIRHLYLGQMVQ